MFKKKNISFLVKRKKTQLKIKIRRNQLPMTFNFKVANLSGIGSFGFQNSFGIPREPLSVMGIIGKDS